MEILEDLSKLSVDEKEELIRSSPVILIGSAISQFSPTNILSGISFTNQLYEYIFSEDIFKRNSYNWLKEVFEELPFEAVMECFPIPVRLPAIFKNIYQVDNANELHEYFGKNLMSGNFSSIITPNYDLCIDSILKNERFTNIVRTEEDVAILDYNKPVFFKIHGSAENNFESSLIFTLKKEGRLLEWKVELLKKLIKDKTIIIIGYSGRDFDICPLIAEMNHYKKIIWIHRKSDKTTAYQDFLIKSKLSNKIVYGLFEDFTTFWSNEKFNLNPDSSSKNQFHLFELKEIEIHQWQLNILNRIACPNIGMKKILNIKSELSEDFVENFLFGMYGHRGEYKKAAKLKENARLKKSKESRDYIFDLIAESSSWLPYGNFIKSYCYLKRAKELTREFFPIDNELRTITITTEITFLMKINQILNQPLFFLFFPLNLYVKQKAENLKHQKEIEYLLTSGFLDSRQSNLHNLDRLGIDSGINTLSAFKAYKSLGLPGMAIIAYRDKIRYNKWEEGESQFEIELKNCIDRAENLGMNTELWKLCKLYIQKCKLSKEDREKYWKKWKINLKTTEYSLAYRIPAYFQLYLYWFRTL